MVRTRSVSLNGFFLKYMQESGEVMQEFLQKACFDWL